MFWKPDMSNWESGFWETVSKGSSGLLCLVFHQIPPWGFWHNKGVVLQRHALFFTPSVFAALL